MLFSHLEKDGQWLTKNGTIEFIPAMKVDAIETTGAGDSLYPDSKSFNN